MVPQEIAHTSSVAAEIEVAQLVGIAKKAAGLRGEYGVLRAV